MSDQPSMSPINSTMFDGHHYDPTSHVMTVRYKNGSVWHYDGVSPEKNAAFLSAESAGGFFNKHIKTAHAGRRGEQ